MPDAFEELGQGVCLDHRLGRFRVRVQARAHHEGAEVEGAGLGGNLGDDAEGGALVGAGEVDLGLGLAGLGNPEGFGARAGGGV